tara:strand:- start:3 stop:440 length:438 start_codon:yes stop_codon:yes gene_type:complete
MAQSILIRHGEHVPTVFVYDEHGIERISELSDLFSVENKDMVFGVLRQFLNEVNAKAMVLITEVWFRKADMNTILEDDEKKVSECNDRREALTIHWEYNFEEHKEGVMNFPFENNDGSVSILYDECFDSECDGKNFQGRSMNLLK